MRIFPGTLNVIVETPLHFRRGQMIRWDGWKHAVWYCPARLNGKEVYLHDWKTRPRDRLEIVADVKLREVFGFDDGDLVEVTIPSAYLGHVGRLPRWQRFMLDHEAEWEAARRLLGRLVVGLKPLAAGRSGNPGSREGKSGTHVAG